jgi:hypothetical protein
MPKINRVKLISVAGLIGAFAGLLQDPLMAWLPWYQTSRLYPFGFGLFVMGMIASLPLLVKRGKPRRLARWLST